MKKHFIPRHCTLCTYGHAVRFLGGSMKKHLIAAENFILGPTNFLILALPEGWTLLKGTAPPEVDRNRLYVDAQWVTDGRSPHILAHPERRIGAHMQVLVHRGRRSLEKIQASPGAGAFPLEIGHEALFWIGQARKGLWRRWVEKVIRLAVFCDRTDRTITLEIAGRFGEEEAKELLEALKWVECH